MADLLASARQYLIDSSIARDPRVAGALHPAWLEPRDGAVAPGEKEGDEDDLDLVISIFLAGGSPVGIFEDANWRRDAVDFYLRGRTAKLVFEFERDHLRPAFVADNAVPRLGWTMGGMNVLGSQLWRPLQPVARGEQGYTFVVSFLIESYLT